jgi:hypothetical protein
MIQFSIRDGFLGRFLNYEIHKMSELGREEFNLPKGGGLK